MRISDWSSDVCSSVRLAEQLARTRIGEHEAVFVDQPGLVFDPHLPRLPGNVLEDAFAQRTGQGRTFEAFGRSEEHTSELQSLMRISYAVFCLKKKTIIKKINATSIAYKLVIHITTWAYQVQTNTSQEHTVVRQSCG